MLIPRTRSPTKSLEGFIEVNPELEQATKRTRRTFQDSDARGTPWRRCITHKHAQYETVSLHLAYSSWIFHTTTQLVYETTEG
jgi:hypothetical protein